MSTNSARKKGDGAKLTHPILETGWTAGTIIQTRALQLPVTPMRPAGGRKTSGAQARAIMQAGVTI